MHYLHSGSYSTMSTVYKHGNGVESKPFRARPPAQPPLEAHVLPQWLPGFHDWQHQRGPETDGQPLLWQSSERHGWVHRELTRPRRQSAMLLMCDRTYLDY